MTRTLGRSTPRRGAAALVGATALIAMGVVGAVAAGGPDPQTAVVSDGSMSTGETTTLTYTGTIAPVVNAPVVKATPFGEG